MSHLIECQGLRKSFAGKAVLKGIDTVIEAGQPIALVGPNGAGKTTFFSLLSGYLPLSGGSLRIMGHPPAARALLGRVSGLPQDAQLDPRFSIKQQFQLFAKLQGMTSHQATQEAARVMGLVELGESLNARPNDLSHGMRKRVSIAQALMGKPELVLLDEPTSGLDPVSARNVRQLVAELAGPITFIISSHNLQELERLCETVLHLDGGLIKQQTSLVLGSGGGGSSEQNYLTVQMQSGSQEQFVELVGALPAVDKVSVKQKNEFVIEYNHAMDPCFDQHLLSFLRDKKWHYRALVRGKTLEDKLFSS